MSRHRQRSAEKSDRPIKRPTKRAPAGLNETGSTRPTNPRPDGPRNSQSFIRFLGHVVHWIPVILFVYERFGPGSS